MSRGKEDVGDRCGRSQKTKGFPDRSPAMREVEYRVGSRLQCCGTSASSRGEGVGEVNPGLLTAGFIVGTLP